MVFHTYIYTSGRPFEMTSNLVHSFLLRDLFYVYSNGITSQLYVCLESHTRFLKGIQEVEELLKFLRRGVTFEHGFQHLKELSKSCPGRLRPLSINAHWRR